MREAIHMDFFLSQLSASVLGWPEPYSQCPVCAGGGLGSILGHHPGGVSDRVRWGGGGRHMDRQVSLLRRRRAETAGWLGVRVRHSAGQEGPGEGGTVRGDSPGSGAGRPPPALGSSCTPGVEWVVLRWYNRGTGSATMAPWSPSCSPGPSPHPGHRPLDGPLGPP